SEQQIATELFLHWPSVEGGLIVLYAVFVAPLVEELLFRGFFLPPLIERLGAWGGIVVTAVLFGLMHLSDPLVVPPLVLLGVALGWLRHRSGSVWTSLALHMLNNGLAVASVLLLE
ncbi:MAG: CPBP family intramembrane glutamic endopeptidase, partial [Myxococcota bacterium]